jgi:signal transduction histidine kinase
MLDPRTLRGRLALAYASALTVGLIVFGAVSTVLLDTLQRNALDQDLLSSMNAILAVVDTSGERIDPDVREEGRLNQILGVKLSGAIFGADGGILASNVRDVSPTIRKFVLTFPPNGLTTIGTNENRVRVATRVIDSPRGRAGVVALWRSTELSEDIALRAAAIFGLVIPVLALVALLVGGLIAQRGLRPLEKIVMTVSEIEANDLTKRLGKERRAEELSRLSATFDKMLDRIEAAFQRQRQFTADASHELRAPLSIIRAEADLALRRERSGEEYRHALTAIAREADALEALARDLLAVARADSGPPQQSDAVDLAQVVADAADRSSVLASCRGLTIQRSLEPAFTAGDGAAFTRVAVALLHNALKYSPEGGVIELIVRSGDGSVELIVRDSGPG